MELYLEAKASNYSHEMFLKKGLIVALLERYALCKYQNVVMQLSTNSQFYTSLSMPLQSIKFKTEYYNKFLGQLATMLQIICYIFVVPITFASKSDKTKNV